MLRAHPMVSQILTVVFHFLSSTFYTFKKTSPPHFAQALSFLSPHHLHSFFVRGLLQPQCLNWMYFLLMSSATALNYLVYIDRFSSLLAFPVEKRRSDFAHVYPCWAWKPQLESYMIFHEGRTSKNGLVICLSVTTASIGQTRQHTPKACRTRANRQHMQGNHFPHV